MRGSVAMVAPSAPLDGGTVSSVTYSSVNPSSRPAAPASSGLIACWPNRAEVVHTSLRPHASASAFQVSFLANLAANLLRQRCSLHSGIVWRVDSRRVSAGKRVRCAPGWRMLTAVRPIHPVTSPSSSASSAFMARSSSVKSNSAPFSAMRARFVDFGSTAAPAADPTGAAPAQPNVPPAARRP